MSAQAQAEIARLRAIIREDADDFDWLASHLGHRQQGQAAKEAAERCRTALAEVEREWRLG